MRCSKINHHNSNCPKVWAVDLQHNFSSVILMLRSSEIKEELNISQLREKKKKKNHNILHIYLSSFFFFPFLG